MFCNICCDNVNKLIICINIKHDKDNNIYNKCNFSACKDCIKNYTLSSNKYMNCMQCGEFWSREFIYNIFNDDNDNDFIINEYYNHKNNILFNNIINSVITKNNLQLYDLKNKFLNIKQTLYLKNKLLELNTKINNNIDFKNYILSLNKFEYINKKIINMYTYYYNMYNNNNSSEYIKLININEDTINNNINNIIKIINSLSIYNYNYWYKYYQDYIKKDNKNMYIINYVNIINKDIIKEDNDIFNIKCATENCKGILNNNEYYCLICEQYTCNLCHELKSMDHTCDQNNVLTVSLYIKDSKPCPKCKIFIFKIEGCSMMFCTKCFTSFNWNTEKIYKNNIHNPHYFEMLRNMDVNINLCDDEININNPIIKQDTTVLNIIQRINHLSEVELDPTEIQGNNKIFHFNNNIIDINNELIIRYKYNHINENYIKNKLLQNEDNHLKNIELNEIMNVLIQSTRSIILSYSNECNNHNREKYLEKINNIRDEINKGLYNISKWYYNNYYYSIDNNYKINKIKI